MSYSYSKTKKKQYTKALKCRILMKERHLIAYFKDMNKDVY